MKRALLALLVAGCAQSPPGTKPDWVVALGAPSPLSPALLGHYELSGALFHYDQNAALKDAMQALGFAEWRVGVGRWEISTRLLPTTDDGRTCAVSQFPPESLAPVNATTLDLIASRDWLIDDGNPVTIADTANDARYQLAYVRSVLDVAKAFGARAYVDLDHMPRALAINRTPFRGGMPVGVDACLGTWTNRVSNVRPADPNVFAAAAVGLVQRLVLGSGGEPGRDAPYWELWNEPELGYAWDPMYETTPGKIDAWVQMAATTLVQLDAFRKSATDARVQGLKFGLGSFASAATAVTLLQGFDANPLPGGGNLPFDFVSFHAYDNDPTVIVDAMASVAAARAASTHYRNVELSLAEWNTDLTNGPPDSTMERPLHHATVIAGAAALALEHAHQSIFYDFYAPLPFGLVANDGTPRPLYHAYELLQRAFAPGASRLAVDGAANGLFAGSDGAVLATRGSDGKRRVLVINRANAPRLVRVDAGGQPVAPTGVTLFDDPAEAPHDVAPSALVTVPAQSLALIVLD